MPDAKQNKAFKEAVVAAQQAGAKFPEIVAAQFALESAYGTKMSGANNPFGQKASASEAGSTVATQEFVGGKMTKTTASFKNYISLTKAFEEHVERWDDEVADAATLEDAAAALAKAGYATDPDYAKKLVAVMRSNGVDTKSAGSVGESGEAAPDPALDLNKLLRSTGATCVRNPPP
jgi:flagellum-specific peptidoglycan hydrolase FlgJ